MADQDMDQEIRDASGGDLQDNIETVEGTKVFGTPHPTDGSNEGSSSASGGSSSASGDIPGSDSPQAQQVREEFPRASTEEVIETAERAKAAFGGTGGGGGGGVESDADPAIATGQKPGMGSETSGGQEASADATPSREEVDNAPNLQEQVDETPEGEEMTTGQKFASILGSDPNMKAESKIAAKLSGGDDENVKDI
ncbi:MAG TPA: hypothetical protein VHI31_08545 [Actinomycetota bacterium]|nr:hypothetical protein [Actinomycetota bacterium]